MQIPHSICMGRGIEGDGVSDELFHYLWTKDEVNFSPPINVPDTVFMKYGNPTVWYFTSKDGKIKRKNKQNLTPGHIETSFKKHSLGFDVVALFISIPLEMESYSGQFPSSTIEYLDADGLKNLLFSRSKDLHGILQRFIEPKAVKNEIIRAIWSPKICLLEKAENIHCLHDKKLSIYERCVTFEGPQGYYNSSPLRGSVLAGQIQRACDSLVAHVCDVSFNSIQISRMAINFKVDSRDKVWMLFTTSIRCKETQTIPFTIGNQTASLSSTSTNSRRPINIDNSLNLPISVMLSSVQCHELISDNSRVICPSCAKDTINDKSYPVTYKSLMKQHEYFLIVAKEHKNTDSIDEIDYPPVDPDVIEASGGLGFGAMKNIPEYSDAYMQRHEIVRPDFNIREIPPIILKANPKLNRSSFAEIRDNEEFLAKTVNLCEPCCLKYSEFTTKTLVLGSDMQKLRQSIQQEQSPIKPSHPPSASLTQTLPLIIGAKDAKNIEQKVLHYGEFIPSSNHIAAKKRSIGFVNDSLAPPAFPKAIIEVDASKVSTANSMRTASEDMAASDDSTANIRRMASITQYSYDKTKLLKQNRLNAKVNEKFFETTAYDPNDIPGMLAERQRLYIEELLKEQEDIAVQTLTKSFTKDDGDADEHEVQIPTTTSPLKSSSEGKMVHQKGKTCTDQKKYDVYKQEIPYFVKGQRVYESKLRRKLRLEGIKKQKFEQLLDQQSASSLNQLSNQDFAELDNIGMDNMPDMISAITAGSRNHLRFLQEALDEIHFEDAFEIGLRAKTANADAIYSAEQVLACSNDDPTLAEEPEANQDLAETEQTINLLYDIQHPIVAGNEL
jgi:hypothetical protein